LHQIIQVPALSCIPKIFQNLLLLPNTKLVRFLKAV